MNLSTNNIPLVYTSLSLNPTLATTKAVSKFYTGLSLSETTHVMRSRKVGAQQNSRLHSSASSRTIIALSPPHRQLMFVITLLLN